MKSLTFESTIVSAIYCIAFCLVVVIGLSGIQFMKYSGKKVKISRA